MSHVILQCSGCSPKNKKKQFWVEMKPRSGTRNDSGNTLGYLVSCAAQVVTRQQKSLDTTICNSTSEILLAAFSFFLLLWLKSSQGSGHCMLLPCRKLKILYVAVSQCQCSHQHNSCHSPQETIGFVKDQPKRKGFLSWHGRV